MVNMYQWHQIKILKQEGMGIRKIARKMGISKNTVKKYLRNENPPEIKIRSYEKKAEKYDKEIKIMIELEYIGTRIHNELKKVGYDGSLSTIHRYIKIIKNHAEVNKQITTRFETSPGEQMQYDWKEWVLPVNKKPLKIYIHELILSYSRKKYYTYSLTIKTSDIIRAIENGIKYFEGIASEILTDNPKQIIINHAKDGIIRYNDEFLRFCGLYGINPKACMPYRARTKGKAERPFYYMQEHLLKGLEVNHLSDFDLKLEIFMNEYNNRVHSTLKESPENMYLKEKIHLKPVPCIAPYILYSKELRHVTQDGYISYNGNFYPVPMNLCLKEVTLESFFGRKISIYDPKGSLAIEHDVILSEKGYRPIHPEHEEINKRMQEKKNNQKCKIAKKFIDLFEENGKIYLDELKKKTGVNLYWHIYEIIKYTEVYGISELSSVLSECINMNAYHKNTVKRLLADRSIQKPKLDGISFSSFNCVNISRPLSEYRMEV